MGYLSVEKVKNGSPLRLTNNGLNPKGERVNNGPGEIVKPQLLLCHFHESVQKVLVDFLLDVYPAGCETDLSLVDEGRPDHGRETLGKVRVFENYASILPSQLRNNEQREKISYSMYSDSLTFSSGTNQPTDERLL